MPGPEFKELSIPAKILRMVKWGFYALLFAGLVLVVDLYTFQFIVQDPGPYVVARRSDTPDQVLAALRNLDLKTVSDTELQILKNRYRQKRSAGDLTGPRREKWSNAYRKTRKFIIQKAQTSEDTAP